MKPGFIIIGAQKCATSTVTAYLEDHTDVFMIDGFEPNFFSHDDIYANGETWYDAHFDGNTEGLIAGEGSNNYAARDMYPDAARRMAAYNPDLKLIYMVRHPMKRIVSSWIQYRVDDGDLIPSSVDKAVQEMPDMFVGQSLYWHNLQPYFEHFPKENIFVGFVEDMSRDPDAFFAALCAFLGVEPTTVERAHLNPSAGKKVPTGLYTTVNRLPLIGLLKSLLPKGLKTAVKDNVLSAKASDIPDFSDAVRAQVLAKVTPDAEALLVYCGKPKDFWTF